MHVAAARLNLHLPASQSLKDRRRVVRSLIERTRAKFNAALADVGGQETWQIAVIGISIVSSNRNHAEQMMDSATRFIEEFSPEAIVTGIDSDVIPFED